MRGRVAVLILSFLLATSAFPQCTWSPRTTMPFRASVLDIAVDGTDLWVATSYGVQWLDRSTDPPSLVASLAVPGTTRVVRPHASGYIYAGSGSRIYVLRKNGRTIEIVRGVDAGGNVNDLHFAGSYFFAATSNGLAHFDTFDPASPVRTSVILPTSTPNVTSLAAAGTLLYAADGDATVEIYSLASTALPQKTDELELAGPASAVHATTHRLYVSDGQRTDVYTGKFKEATLPFGAASLATLANEIHFVAGRDRTVRVVDFSLAAQPSGLFEELLPGSGGTVNRISAMQVAGGRAYVAAGDIGLVTYDLSAFSSPYPLHSHSGATTSAFVMNRVYATNAMPTGGIVEYELATDGSLNPRRSWAAETRHTLLDGNAGLLLTGHGTQVIQWDLATSTPSNAAGAEFDLPIRSAVLMHAARGYVLLEDDSLWTVNFVPGGSTKQRIGTASLLARQGNAAAIARVNVDTGNTELHYAASGDLATITRIVTIPGVANGTLALGPNHAAVGTFRGINVIELGNGNVSVLPDSLIAVSPKLRIEGNRLLALTNDHLVVFDLPSARRLRSFAIEAGTSLHVAGTTAAVATPGGITSVAYESRAELPRIVAAANPNRFHTKLAVAPDRAYLFSRDGIDIYDTEAGRTPHFITSVRPTALFDAAAGAGGLYTLATNGLVTWHTRDGAPLAQTTINEGSDTQMLGIFSAGNAVWVAFSKGCLTGACERKTAVLDPRTLAVTSTLAGGAIDVAVSGNRAYALFRLPNEVRVYDVADPLHPGQLVQAAAPANAVSLAHGSGLVHVLADKVYSLNETTLAAAGDRLAAAPTADTHRIRIEGTCAIVTGRALNPELFTLPDWMSATTFEVPSTVRALATQEGRIFVLTDHSLEVWGAGDGKPGKKRAVR